MKRVFSSFNLQLVHHQRNLLHAEGIEAVVRNELLSSGMGELPPAECQAELWEVNDLDAKRAEAILLGTGVSGPQWACACGETLEPQFTHCWRCGAPR